MGRRTARRYVLERMRENARAQGYRAVAKTRHRYFAPARPHTRSLRLNIKPQVEPQVAPQEEPEPRARWRPWQRKHRDR